MEARYAALEPFGDECLGPVVNYPKILEFGVSVALS